MDCPNCRRPIPPQSEFCLYCGTRLSPESPLQQPVSSSPADAQAEEAAAPPEHFCSTCGKALDIHGKCPRCSRPSARAKKKPLFSAVIVLLAGLNLILLCLQLPYIALSKGFMRYSLPRSFQSFFLSYSQTTAVSFPILFQLKQAVTALQEHAYSTVKLLLRIRKELLKTTTNLYAVSYQKEHLLIISLRKILIL